MLAILPPARVININFMYNNINLRQQEMNHRKVFLQDRPFLSYVNWTIIGYSIDEKPSTHVK